MWAITLPTITPVQQRYAGLRHTKLCVKKRQAVVAIAVVQPPTTIPRQPDTSIRYDTSVPQIQPTPAVDAPPYSDGLYSWLTGEYYPDSHTTAELSTENLNSGFPPEIRRCPTVAKQMVSRAQHHIGHSSKHDLVKRSKTAACQTDAVAFARHMVCPTCRRRTLSQRRFRAAMPYNRLCCGHIVALELKFTQDSLGAL